MHDGTAIGVEEGAACQVASLFESQPHPRACSINPGEGLVPVKPSRSAATSSMWAPQLGMVSI